MFELELSVEDGERGLVFELRVVGEKRPETRPRMGWRDGGDPGEAREALIQSVSCSTIGIVDGKRVIEVGLGTRQVQRLIGEWCLSQYEAEIVNQVQRQFGVVWTATSS